MKILTRHQLAELSGRSGPLIDAHRADLLRLGHAIIIGKKPKYLESAIAYMANLPDGRTLRLWAQKENNMTLFRTDNTDGYSQEEIDVLNAEWDNRAKTQGIEKHTDEYDQAAKSFCDEVARR